MNDKQIQSFFPADEEKKNALEGNTLVYFLKIKLNFQLKMLLVDGGGDISNADKHSHRRTNA